MLEYMIPILTSWLSLDFMQFWFFPLLAIAFLASFPRIVRRITEWR